MSRPHILLLAGTLMLIQGGSDANGSMGDDPGF